MLINSIVQYLKANQSIISLVVPVDGANNNVGGGEEPYILVGEMNSDDTQSGNGLTSIFIRVAYPPLYQDDLDLFILYTLRTLLNKKRIEITTAGVVSHTILYVTNRITDIRPTTNGYIYRDRIIEVPCRWR